MHALRLSPSRSHHRSYQTHLYGVDIRAAHEVGYPVFLLWAAETEPESVNGGPSLPMALAHLPRSPFDPVSQVTAPRITELGLARCEHQGDGSGRPPQTSQSRRSAVRLPDSRVRFGALSAMRLDVGDERDPSIGAAQLDSIRSSSTRQINPRR